MQNTLYNRLYYGQFFCIVPLIVIIKRCEGILGVLSVIAMALILSYLTYNAILLFRALPKKIPYLKVFYVGSTLMLGSALLDMIVTIMCSPNLAQEGNLTVLMLLKIHAPLWFIYLFMLFSELVFIVLSISLWGCFLKTYDDIVSRIPYKSLITTLKWLSGSGAVSGLKLFFNLKIDTYFAMSLTTIIYVVMQIAHVYAALEWLDVIPIFSYLRLTAIITILLSALIGLVGLTHYKVKQNLTSAPIT